MTIPPELITFIGAVAGGYAGGRAAGSKRFRELVAKLPTLALDAAKQAVLQHERQCPIREPSGSWPIHE